MGGRASRSRKGSGKVRRTERYRYLVGDPDEARAAAAETVAAARLAEMRARDTPGHKHTLRELEAAQAAAAKAVEACYGTIVLRALPPARHQEFVQEMAEREDARQAAAKAAEEAGQPPPEDPEPTWAEDCFEVRMLAACDADPEHTEQWWAAEFDDSDPEHPSEWTPPERTELLDRCFRVNLPSGSFDLGVLGKG